MTGKEGESVTQPQFMRDDSDRLLFFYWSGSSGNGRRFINCYDETTETWTRLFSTTLFDREGKQNAYHHGPTKKQDGYYHMDWVWRDTPDCATIHLFQLLRHFVS